MWQLSFLGVLLLSLVVFASSEDSFILEFVSSEESVHVDKEVTIFYNVTCLNYLRVNSADEDSWLVRFVIGDDSLAEVSSGSPTQTVREMCGSTTGLIELNENESFTFNLTVKGLFLGATGIKAYLSQSVTSGTDKSRLLDEVDLLVLRIPPDVETILGYVILALTILNNFWWGTQFDFTEAKRLIRRPRALVLAMGLQLVFLPAWTYAIASMVHQPDGSLLASLAGSTAHAMSMVIFIIKMADGNEHLAILITIFSFVLCFGTMPLWLLTVGAGLFPGVRVPFISLVQNFGVFLAPLLLGILLYYCVPKCRKPIFIILRPTNVVALVLSTMTVFITKLYLFNFFTFINFLFAVLTSYCVLGLALLMAWSVGLDKAAIVAVGFMTPLRNVLLVQPVMLSVSKFPYIDTWMAPALIASYLGPIAFGPYVLYVRFYKGLYLKRCRKNQDEEKNDPERDTEDSEAGNGHRHSNTDSNETDSSIVIPNGGASGHTDVTANGHANVQTIDGDGQGIVNEGFEKSRL